ncbi:MAG: type II toxin-antitoxin system PemK/MazF family toxin [Planctomycetota bacterium]
MSTRDPCRGEVWEVYLGRLPAEEGDPANPEGKEVVGHEQAGIERPAVIVADERLVGPGMTIVAPATHSPPRSEVHVKPVPSRDAGLEGAILCDQIRAVSVLRLRRFLGQLSKATMSQVEQNLQDLLGL